MERNITEAQNRISAYLAEIDRIDEQLEALSYHDYNEQSNEELQYINYLYEKIAKETNFILYGKRQLHID